MSLCQVPRDILRGPSLMSWQLRAVGGIIGAVKHQAGGFNIVADQHTLQELVADTLSSAKTFLLYLILTLPVYFTIRRKSVVKASLFLAVF